MITDHANRTGLNYELLKALEVAAAILVRHICNGGLLYSSSPRPFTRCQEWIFLRLRGRYVAVVGGCVSGLIVDTHNTHYLSGSALSVAGSFRHLARPVVGRCTCVSHQLAVFGH